MRESEETVTEALSFDEHRRYSVMTVSCLDEGRLFGVQSRNCVQTQLHRVRSVPLLRNVGNRRAALVEVFSFTRSRSARNRTTGVRRWK